jgi:hypothetical protein
MFRFYRLSSSLVDLALTVNGSVSTAIRGGFRDDFRTFCSFADFTESFQPSLCEVVG